MRLKVWYGTHPDERAAIELGRSLEERPIPNIDVGVANKEALKTGERYIKVNMAHAFPGDPHAPEYEYRRAVEILEESEGYDAVVDLHSVSGGADTACISGERGVSPTILGFLGGLGIGSLVLSDKNLPEYSPSPNAFVLELITDGLGREIERLRGEFDRLANGTPPQPMAAEQFNWYVSTHDGLQETQISRSEYPAFIPGFEPLKAEDNSRLGLPDQTSFLCTLDAPNAQGYWADLCVPVPVPDTSRWPR